MHRLQNLNRFVAMACIQSMFVAFIVPDIATAKGPALDWDNVLRLKGKTAISTVLFSGKTYVGKVDRVEATSLALTTAAGALVIPKGDIKTITMIARPKIANPGLYAMAGGVALAAAGGLAGTAKDRVRDISVGRLGGL